MKCMYTTHLSKKRKTWCDGILKVYYSGGSYQCSLIDSGKLRETVLASRQLESIEVQKLKVNEEIELNFENYLVTVSVGLSEHDVSRAGPPLKLPKFVPPSRYVPTIQPNEVVVSSSGNVSQSFGGGKIQGPYNVTSDELDDIWDRGEIPAAPSGVLHIPIQRDSSPPTYLTFEAKGQAGRKTNVSTDVRHSSQEVSNLSVDATLRQTGANANGDPSQPTLTRFFAHSTSGPTSAASAPGQPLLPAHFPPSQSYPPPYGYNYKQQEQQQKQQQDPQRQYYAAQQDVRRTDYGNQQRNPQPGRDPSQSASAPANSHHGIRRNNSDPPASISHPHSDASRAQPAAVHIPPPPEPSRRSLGEGTGEGERRETTTFEGHNARNVAVKETIPVKSTYSTIINSSIWDSD